MYTSKYERYLLRRLDAQSIKSTYQRQEKELLQTREKVLVKDCTDQEKERFLFEIDSVLLEIHRIILEQDREIFENDKIIYRIQSDQQALINKLKMAGFSLDQVKEITTVEFDIIEQVYNSEQ